MKTAGPVDSGGGGYQGAEVTDLGEPGGISESTDPEDPSPTREEAGDHEGLEKRPEELVRGLSTPGGCFRRCCRVVLEDDAVQERLVAGDDEQALGHMAVRLDRAEPAHDARDRFEQLGRHRSLGYDRGWP